MTLIVVDKTRVLIDSFESVGSLDFNIGATKVRTHRTIPGKFLTAGRVSDFRILISTSTTKEELLASHFPCASQDHTVILWVLEGAIWVMECSKDARWYELDRTSDVCYMAGAGWPWFEAFYAAEGNVDDAFAKTCTLHQQCSLPVNIVDINV